eukprot:1127944-Pyramimonas_sp.AAC.1
MPVETGRSQSTVAKQLCLTNSEFPNLLVGSTVSAGIQKYAYDDDAIGILLPNRSAPCWARR